MWAREIGAKPALYRSSAGRAVVSFEYVRTDVAVTN